MSKCFNLIISQYRPGNVGIIISIPHGGLRDDPTIPDRTDGYVQNNNLEEVNNNNCMDNNGLCNKIPSDETEIGSNNKNCANNNVGSVAPSFNALAVNHLWLWFIIRTYSRDGLF